VAQLRITPYLLAQAVVLPVALCLLLAWVRPGLFGFWRGVILFWSGELGVPFELAAQPGGMVLAAGAGDSPLPGQAAMLLTAAATLAAFAASLRMKNESLPLKYPLRIVCAVQAVALAHFWLGPLWPAQPSYSISRHSEELLQIGYVVMLAVPVMLAAGYYILNERLLAKLVGTAAILAFLALLVPHQVMAQALLMHHLSVLFMPVLYICFGAVFDALVFVALYSWVVSGVPPDATL
jgi:hypothetical protein